MKTAGSPSRGSGGRTAFECSYGTSITRCVPIHPPPETERVRRIRHTLPAASRVDGRTCGPPAHSRDSGKRMYRCRSTASEARDTPITYFPRTDRAGMAVRPAGKDGMHGIGCEYRSSFPGMRDSRRRGPAESKGRSSRSGTSLSQASPEGGGTARA